jgi:flagellar protein FlaI
MALTGRFERVLSENPHLKTYLAQYRKSTGKIPTFYERLSIDMRYMDDVNILYSIGDPVFIHIYQTETGSKRYIVVEPELTAQDKLKLDKVLDLIFKKSTAGGLFKRSPREIAERRGEFESEIDKLIADSVTFETNQGFMQKLQSKKKVPMTQFEYKKIRYHIKKDVVGLGILSPLLHDPYVEDVNCIGTAPLSVVHKIFDTMETNIQYKTMADLDEYLRSLSERIDKPLSATDPILDASLPDGSRINIIYAEDVSRKGPSFSIRRTIEEPFTITQLVSFNTLSAELTAYIWLCLENGMNLIVCGESASGKTSTVNAILPFIHYTSKIYSVEDTAEVRPPHRVWQQLLTRESGPEDTRVEMYALVRSALRSRPNYIIIGEIRGREGAMAFQAMQTGHPVISTFHANTIQKMIQRFTGHPINIPVRFMDNLNVVLIQSIIYIKGKILRRVVSLHEIMGYSEEAKGVKTKEVFRWNPIEDYHRFRGMYNSYILEEKIATTLGYSDKRKIYEDLELRAKIIRTMVQRKIFSNREVNNVFRSWQIGGVSALPFPI